MVCVYYSENRGDCQVFQCEDRIRLSRSSLFCCAAQKNRLLLELFISFIEIETFVVTKRTVVFLPVGSCLSNWLNEVGLLVCVKK